MRVWRYGRAEPLGAPLDERVFTRLGARAGRGRRARAPQRDRLGGTDPALLELCLRRVRAMLGSGARGDDAQRARAAGLGEAKLAALDGWRDSEHFTAREHAHLHFTEQFVTSVGSVSAEQVGELLRHGDARAVYSFTAALYVVELTERVTLAARATLLRRGEGV